MTKQIKLPTVPTAIVIEPTDQPTTGDQIMETVPTVETAPTATATASQEVAQEIVTLDQINAYSPTAIDAAITAITAHHATVNAMKGLASAVVDQVRASLGITGDQDQDIAKVKSDLGGKVATLIDSLKIDPVWSLVAEYQTMIENLTMINATRASLGLPLLTVGTGRATAQGATSTGSEIKRTNENSGFMAVGEYADMKVMEGATTDWSVDSETIKVTYNGATIYEGAQGAQSLSSILNTVVRVAVGAGGREGFPAFLRKNGLDPLVIMIAKKPTA